MFRRVNNTNVNPDSLPTGAGYINENLGELIIPLNYLVTGQGTAIGPYSDGTNTDADSFVYHATNPFDIPAQIANLVCTVTYMWFVPAFERKGSNLKRVAIQKVTNGNWNAKGGLYADNGSNKHLPLTLLSDFGTLALTINHGGGEEWNVDYTFPDDGLYWYGMKFDVANQLAAWSSAHPSPWGYIYPLGNGQNIQSLVGVRLQDVTYADAIPSDLTGRTFYACVGGGQFAPKVYRGYAAFSEPVV